MARVYQSLERNELQIALPRDRELLDMKIRVALDTSQMELVESFPTLERISEHFVEPSSFGGYVLRFMQDGDGQSQAFGSRLERPDPCHPMATESVLGFRIALLQNIFDVSTGPWLPPNVLDLLAKARGRPLSEKEIMRLMNALADRAAEHYGLRQGRFAAITFSGKIAEAADTKIDLLRKIQGKKYSEQIFVWEVGSEAFTGWKR